MKRLYVVRQSKNRPLMHRVKLLLSELDLTNVDVQQRNVLQFQPWNTPRFHYINPCASYNGLKRAGYVGCGVMIEDNMHGYRPDTSCSVFTAEAFTIYCTLQLIDSNIPRKYCIYTDIMSVLEALENYNDRCHPVVCNILDITSRLYSKGFNIDFFWLPSHLGIIGNEKRMAPLGLQRPIYG
ncbi:RNase H domain-containing protein [Trichonephila clavipes]|nr:RNase H domain-containing protein [Trichonephila clavipes]